MILEIKRILDLNYRLDRRFTQAMICACHLGRHIQVLGKIMIFLVKSDFFLLQTVFVTAKITVTNCKSHIVMNRVLKLLRLVGNVLFLQAMNLYL